MRDELLRQARRIVIKIGSSLVASREQGLSAERIERLAGEIAEVRAQGREVLVVSSGAVVSGIKKLALREYPKSLPIKQAAAAVGQSHLMWAYEKAFERLHLGVAQILLTHGDLADRRRFLNARHTLTTLIKFGVVPIINENDTVAVEEIRVGDNDTLAAQVAHLVDADLLVILSDVDGLFTADPRKDPTATLIPLIPEITPEIEQRAGLSSTFEGTGGMATKVRAAKKVGEYGVATLILNGTQPRLFPKVFAGEPGGSLFVARERRMNSRKHWIAFTLRPRGQVQLDRGAVEALSRKGKSLLASGIRDIVGQFEAGDPVTCLTPDGKEFAKGLVNFSSAILARIKGLKTADIQKIPGLQEYEEVIHRDNLVVL
ncbi:glutamate 5-kinase [Nitrospirales bacterium NOB]|mgnify:CR=1 FL=1|nr:MAG: glutamat 5-kinase [Nitrospira sp. OLB3]MBV6468742.1 Glutamate 5-kinase [Nitrospirota bacterium]MCE7964075.1 glutamate 5-kinase [Nitrospira sp. NTP2]MDL1890536.1 glutamate 5-kinase [Nitrospirales bacterium NOB]QOJ34555.1 MAG: glutamate 5-kinase [Nitrospira sp.]